MLGAGVVTSNRPTFFRRKAGSCVCGGDTGDVVATHGQSLSFACRKFYQ
jgi:hypothetical protein